MACIDINSLVQYERDAKEGRADALYNLGLAYSTGQGVGVDMVAAHKWFNLAAVRGVRSRQELAQPAGRRNDHGPDRKRRSSPASGLVFSSECHGPQMRAIQATSGAFSR